MTLLERALSEGRKTDPTPDEIEIARAWMNGTISNAQVGAVTDKGHNNVAGYCGSIIRRAIRAGMLPKMEVK